MMKKQACPPPGGRIDRRQGGKLLSFSALLLALLSALLSAAMLLALPMALPAVSAAEEPSGDASAEAAQPLLQRLEKGAILPGDSLTLELSAGGNPAYGFEGEMLYGESTLVFFSAESLLPNWNIYFSGSHFLLCPDTMESPLNTTAPTPVCRFYFRIAEDAVPGKDVGVQLKNFTVTDGTAAIFPGDPSFSGKAASADSKTARLTALSAGSYALQPAFSEDVFDYTVKDLPHSLAALLLTYETKTPDLTVTEDLPPLADGRTVLTLTVTAEDGSAAVYTVTALRNFGDGYQPSSDAALGALEPSAGELSPAFSPENESYLLYLPPEYIGQTLRLTPSPRSEMAAAEALSAVLTEGKNLLTVSCTAEDGSEKLYTVNAVVLPAVEDGLPAPYITGDTSLTGVLTVEETDREYLLVKAISRPDGEYELRWTFNGELCGSEGTLQKSDSLRDGVLQVQMIGRDGFSGSLIAEVYLDENGHIGEKPAEERFSMPPMTAACIGGGLVLSLVVGFLAGIPAGKRSAKQKGSHGCRRSR